MKKLTFAEYMQSKEQLREALSKTPQRVGEYYVQKYCKLVIGETKDEKQYVSLKPKQRIFVEWLYEDIGNPTIVGIKFQGVANIDSEEEHASFWEGAKLQKWLHRNTREEI